MAPWPPRCPPPRSRAHARWETSPRRAAPTRQPTKIPPTQPRYCSSDLWAGNAAASAATFGYSFRGSRIISAVIQDLVTSKGMGSVAGSRLLFAGCSAGAIGAMNNLERVAAMVPGNVQARQLAAPSQGRC